MGKKEDVLRRVRTSSEEIQAQVAQNDGMITAARENFAREGVDLAALDVYVAQNVEQTILYQYLRNNEGMLAALEGMPDE